MGKRMKLPFLFKNTQPPISPSWPWPTCTQQPKTLSFRVPADAGVLPENTSGSEAVETVIRGLRSERLFFEPGGETSSIMEETKTKEEELELEEGFPLKESVVMAMESIDPLLDFKKSMEEMVEAFDLKDWECLQELLSWYLRVNSKVNHGYILGAFVDLLVGNFLDQEKYDDDKDSSSLSTSYSASTNSITSALSFSYSTTSSTLPCLSSLEGDNIENEKIVV
ncbi:hypothetical protein LguiA_024339 [Lonicera macranthoides]